MTCNLPRLAPGERPVAPPDCITGPTFTKPFSYTSAFP